MNNHLNNNIDMDVTWSENPDVKDDVEKNNNSKKRNKIFVLIKTFSMLILALGLLVFVGIAWFSMSKDVETSGMNIKVQASPYTIVTRNQSGYYKEQWDKLNSQAVEWQISQAYNFDNYNDGLAPDQTDLGLEPSDSGMLEFRVNPNNSDSITVDCVFDFKAYVEKPVLGENDDPILDENDEPVTELIEITNEDLLEHVKTHIMLFSEYDPVTCKYDGLISTDVELKRVLEQTYTRGEEDYTTIYWAWPEHLENFISHDNSEIIYVPSQRTAVINYVAKNRTGFFKDCKDDENTVKSELTALSQAYDNPIYNRYNMKYDNADLDIGNNISYVLLSMTVEQ